MEYRIQQSINKLSRMYNYFNSKVAIKLLSSMPEEEKKIVLSDPRVQKTILQIDDFDVLRTIFTKSPAFFQEIMFNNERIQDILILPRRTLKRKDLLENYNKKDYVFKNEDIKKLENILHSIRSPQICEQLVEIKLFKIIIVLLSDKEWSRSFLKGIDEVKLFNNIISDEEIFNTKKSRKRNILTAFNNVSDHILLSEDYDEILDNSSFFIRSKRRKTSDLERVYVDKRTLSLLSNEVLAELLEFENIDKEFVNVALEDNIKEVINGNNYDFNKIFSHIIDNNYVLYNGVDKLYFDIISDECKENEDLKKRFVDFIYGILCNTQDLNENEIKIVKDELYKRMSLDDIKKDDYIKLFWCPDALKTIFYLKFGKTAQRMDYLNGISPKQLIYLNVKHVNQILKLLNLENEDEMSNTYSYAIKLYFTFGLERTLKILNWDYGKLSRTFFDNISALNVSNVVLEKEGSKYIPNISNEFINFMFANPKKNHFIDMLDGKAEELNKFWSYLFNNFDELKERCHNVVTLKKLNIIFKDLLLTRDISDVSPDNYKLNENDILNDVCLGNKSKKSNEEVYKTLLDIYEQMKKRIESSIPYVKGVASNGYSYEMMKLNNPIVFTLGYKGDCCIRVHDVAHNHLLHATLCRNGRVLLIYDEFHKIAGFVPLKRNGEVLIANSIECLHKQRNEKTIEAFSDAIKKIVSTSQSNLEDKVPINLVCIGTEAYARPDGTPFPNDIETPTIFEKDDSIYGHTDNYHRKLTIVYKKPKLDLHNLKYGDPDVSYQEPRPSISSCDFYNSSDSEKARALKVINAIRYTNSELEELENFRLCNERGIEQCIFNDDWYILTSYGNIYGDYLSNDPRAEKEYNIALAEFKEQFDKGTLSDDIKFVKRFK